MDENFFEAQRIASAVVNPEERRCGEDILKELQSFLCGLDRAAVKVVASEAVKERDGVRVSFRKIPRRTMCMGGGSKVMGGPRMEERAEELSNRLEAAGLIIEACDQVLAKSSP